MAGTDAIAETQNALYTVLSNDSALSALITGVFDAVPQTQTFPYIVLGDMIQVPDDSFGDETSHTYNITATLHIWSRAQGFAEALTINRQIYRLLHRQHQNLSLNGYSCTLCYHAMTWTLRDPDGLTRHVPVRYKVVVQEL